MASPEFDFPDPFGPVMAVDPDWNGMDTSPPNDLKLRTSILTNRIPNPHKAVFLTTLDGKPHSAVLSTLSINEGAAYRLGGLIVITVFSCQGSIQWVFCEEQWGVQVASSSMS